MNLRFPLVAAVVGVAAVAAGLRALQPHAGAAALSVASALPASAPAVPSRAAPARPSPHPIVVYVAGEVVRSGLYTVPASSRAADALRAAGGPAPGADLVAVNLAARLADGDEVAVPPQGASVRKSSRARAAPPGGRRTKRSRKAKHPRARRAPFASDDAAADGVPTELVDLNAADVDALETLPGIGPALAERIVTVRDQSGPFASTDDLLDVGGMTQGKLDAIAPYVTLR